LYLRKNRIQEFPSFEKCCLLKEIDLSINQIKVIDSDKLKGLTALVYLNLKDNQVESIPKEIGYLKNLERIDLTNNNLTSLPAEIGLLENFKHLLIYGNPLRNIRRDILNRGSDAIVKFLRLQLDASQLNGDLKTPASGTNGAALDLKDLRTDLIRATKAFDFSLRKASQLPANFVELCLQCSSSTINISKNTISQLPENLNKLNEYANEFIYSFNNITVIPAPLYSLTNLTRLDLRGNQLSDIHSDITKMQFLFELVISDNKFTQIPACVYELKSLENLFANDNKIQFIDAQKIMNLKRLSTLNLQNNDISQLQPELGLCTQLRYLQLEGNAFRLPRPNVLAKGTNAVLDYLRGRITA